MKPTTFEQMQGLTFADFADTAAFGPETKPEVNRAIAKSFEEDPLLRVVCPVCHGAWEGTFEQLTLHVELCDAPS